jgi:hypothetical protein
LSAIDADAALHYIADDGKILSFDLPCLEFYATAIMPTTGVVREGRLKHISSQHRLFGTGLDQGMFPDEGVSRARSDPA